MFEKGNKWAVFTCRREGVASGVSVALDLAQARQDADKAIPRGTYNNRRIGWGTMQNCKVNYDNTPVLNQAKKVFEKFGGVKRFQQALEVVGCHRELCNLYRWTYPWPKGTGGVIPPTAWPMVLLAARHEGILLTPTDLAPSFPSNVDKRVFPQIIHGNSRLYKQLVAQGKAPARRKYKLNRKAMEGAKKFKRPQGYILSTGEKVRR